MATHPEMLFARFTLAYLADVTQDADFTGDAIEVQVETWDAYEAAVGKETAIARFWSWQRTLPHALQSDVDPHGN